MQTVKFYVVLKDGRRFGPADVTTLNQWIKEGRVNRDTMLENSDTAQKLHARDLPGLQFSSTTGGPGGYDPLKPQQPTQQTTTHSPGSPYVAGGPHETGGPAPSPYASPPQPGSPYPRAAPHYDDGTAKMINTAWILIAVGFVCCFIATPFGIYQANEAKKLGNPNANAPFIVGWILFGLQLIGVLVYVFIFAAAFAGGGFQ